jgi:rhodanese-related sulfurtransferase
MDSVKEGKIMKNWTFAFVFTALAALASTAAQAKDSEKLKLIHVNDLTAMMQSKAPVPSIFDANNEKTRKESGIIPGAVLLQSSKGYNVATTLPKDKGSELVFYCANPKCMSSHEAANKAIKAGYKHVMVLADGIQGWVASGQKVDKMPN